MRRVGRWLLNGFVMLSLLLCLAAAAFWVRGYWVFDSLDDDNGRRKMSLDSSRGSLQFLWDSPSHFNPRTSGVGPPRWVVGHDRPPLELLGVMRAVLWAVDVPHFAGFAWWTTESTADGFGLLWVVVPLWSIVVLTAVAPAVWAVRRLRRRGRHSAGLCSVCGYDLRASPGRCPECGTIARAG